MVPERRRRVQFAIRYSATTTTASPWALHLPAAVPGAPAGGKPSVPALHIFRGLAEARQGFAPAAVTIGNFDGVHAGHRQLMRRTRAIAAGLGVKASALTFHPHPATIVAPERPKASRMARRLGSG